MASSVIALNALSGRRNYSQDQFFTPAVSATCRREAVERDGMTLRDLGTCLSLHGASVKVEHADETSLAEFRSVAEQRLYRNRDFVIVNYHRGHIGQRGGGHFSPLAAYHRASDRVLILDVAEIRYPPVWVTTPNLFAAMASFDPMARRSRGYAVVRR